MEGRTPRSGSTAVLNVETTFFSLGCEHSLGDCTRPSPQEGEIKATDKVVAPGRPSQWPASHWATGRRHCSGVHAIHLTHGGIRWARSQWRPADIQWRHGNRLSCWAVARKSHLQLGTGGPATPQGPSPLLLLLLPWTTPTLRCPTCPNRQLAWGSIHPCPPRTPTQAGPGSGRLHPCHRRDPSPASPPAHLTSLHETYLPSQCVPDLPGPNGDGASAWNPPWPWMAPARLSPAGPRRGRASTLPPATWERQCSAMPPPAGSPRSRRPGMLLMWAGGAIGAAEVLKVRLLVATMRRIRSLTYEYKNGQNTE